MFKKSLLLGLLLTVLILPGLSVPCAAQDVIWGEVNTSPAELQESFLALKNTYQEVQNGSIISKRSATPSGIMTIPYNIIVGNWITGLNISCWKDNELLTVVYIHAGEAYFSRKIKFEKALSDLTFLVNAPKFLEGIDFKSPTTIMISSESGPFTVSQFIMNGSSGFGYQTFLSH